jgi:trans-aconitate methyltransferase
MDELMRLYTDLAGWFHLLTAPEDYAEEAARYRELLDERGPVRTVLELGSGGGNNASHLRAWYELTLTDRSPEMLAVSRRLNPDLEHVAGDLRDLRLDRTFDAVFAHDAVSYLTTEADLDALFATAAAHLAPGGVALICPDGFSETFDPGTRTGGHDGDGRSLRYLEWEHDTEPDATTVVVDYAYLLREGDRVEVVHDRHVVGRFPQATWVTAFECAGFDGVEVLPGAEGGYRVLRGVRRP